MQRRISLTVWVFALLAAPAWPQTPDAAWTVKSVHGYRFAFAVETVLDSNVPGDPKHARLMDHRMVVSIRDEQTGRPLQITAVSLDVAEQGYKGVSVPMQIVGAGDTDLYEARVRLQRGLLHRILVHADPEARGRVLEAQFEYRHHH